ncbi:MAG TPA: L-threonylcarbamoyladenylate synthase, partial [Acidimicrobiia bacterium]|nr:L-threonylcarbamoyladenylate synthase [Acidimicrobiia bacterium]
ACWPGPLTLVVRKNPTRVCNEATAGLDTVGLRVPAHPLALALLEAFGGGVAAPSANRFGRVSPTTAEHVRADLDGDVDLILDGGPCAVGVESTIVDVTADEPILLRLGGVSEARLTKILGSSMTRRTTGEVAAPGTLPAHYAPKARVEIIEAAALAGRATALREQGLNVETIEPSGDLEADARALYARLRAADARAADVVLAVIPDDKGIGAAIADRLRRAAASSG